MTTEILHIGSLVIAAFSVEEIAEEIRDVFPGASLSDVVALTRAEDFDPDLEAWEDSFEEAKTRQNDLFRIFSTRADGVLKPVAQALRDAWDEAFDRTTGRLPNEEWRAN